MADVYSKYIGYKFQKLKIIGAIVFIVGCLVNPILNDLAFFLVGSSVGFLGLLMGLEKTTKKNLCSASRIEVENDNFHLFIEDKKLKITVDKNSAILQKFKCEGENILIFNSGIIVCKVEEQSVLQ